MVKVKFMLVYVACLGIAGTGMHFLTGQPVSAYEPQVREGRETSTSQHSGMKTKEMWKQISRLHSQIVAAELQDDAGRSSATDRPGASSERPGTPGARTPSARAPSERADQRTNPGLTSAGSDSDTEQLWMQLAQVHKQIVAKEAGEGEGRTRFFRGGPRDRQPQSPEQKQLRDRNPRERQSEAGSPVDPLWQKYVQLHQQIVAADVKQAKEKKGEDSSTETQDRDTNLQPQRDRNPRQFDNE